VGGVLGLQGGHPLAHGLRPGVGLHLEGAVLQPGEHAVGVAAVPEPDALKARREALGVTQREFAGLLGLTRGSWAAVESGTRPGIGHRRHAQSVLARLEDGTLQVQADPRAESVRLRVASLKAQYAAHRASLVGELKAAWDALPPEQREAE